MISIFSVITQVSERTSAFENPALENSKLQNFVNFSVDRGSSYSSLPSCAETYILPKFCNNVRKRRLCKVSTMAPDQELSHFYHHPIIIVIIIIVIIIVFLHVSYHCLDDADDYIGKESKKSEIWIFL